MKKTIFTFGFFSMFLLVCGCNQMSFSPASIDIPIANEFPTDPRFTFKLSDGICKSDSSTEVLSCLKCDVPQVTPKPQLSVKAQALMDSMFLACQIPNKSDLNNFRPTLDMILNKLNQASPLNYPDSPRTAMMNNVIQGLTDPNNNSLRQKMFGGLWYQPPYSDAFETYFGITVQEAKSTFCWNGDQMNGVVSDQTGLYSKYWVDCNSGNNPFNCQELPAYVSGLQYRQQLEDSLHLGLVSPYNKPIPDPQKICKWDKFEGDDLKAAQKQLAQWLTQERKVSIHVKNSDGSEACGQASTDFSFKAGAFVELASYLCQ